MKKLFLFTVILASPLFLFGAENYLASRQEQRTRLLEELEETTQDTSISVGCLVGASILFGSSYTNFYNQLYTHNGQNLDAANLSHSILTTLCSAITLGFSLRTLILANNKREMLFRQLGKVDLQLELIQKYPQLFVGKKINPRPL